VKGEKQLRRHTRACQGKCPGRNTSTLAAAMAVKRGNNKIILLKIFVLPLLMRLMTCQCPAMSSGLAPPLEEREGQEWKGSQGMYQVCT